MEKYNTTPFNYFDQTLNSYHTNNFQGALNFLSVHSNSYVEDRRNQYRNIAKDMNQCIMCLQDYPTYCRPEWPFLPWESTIIRPHIDPDVFLSKYDATFDPHEKKTQSKKGDILTDILKEDSSKINYQFIEYLLEEHAKSVTKKRSEDYGIVINDVRIMMKNTFDAVEKKHKIFRNYAIIEMGSIGEDTKVGNPDEFDFMIELPGLNETLEIIVADKVDVLGNAEKKKIRVNEQKLFVDFKDLDMEGVKDEDILRKLWNMIQIEIAETFNSSVLPNWKWLDTVPGYMSNLAQTQTLLWSGGTSGRLIVHIDICICFKPQKFNAQMDFNQETLDITRPGIKSEDKSLTDPDYLLLCFDGKARWTRSVKEKQIWCMFPSENGRKIVYRCLKFLVLNYLPKQYNDGLFRLDPLIPSYWIKTIMFYVMTYFHEDKFWVKDQLALRLVEIFLILRKCLLDKNLSSFFVPHNVLSKYYPIIRSKGLEDEITGIIGKVNELYSIILSPDPRSDDLCVYTAILKNTEKENKTIQDQGLFRSVIELCYFYAYNDFNEKNLNALQSFIELFLHHDIFLKGVGKQLEIVYKGDMVDINSKISEYYNCKQSYFE